MACSYGGGVPRVGGAPWLPEVKEILRLHVHAVFEIPGHWGMVCNYYRVACLSTCMYIRFMQSLSLWLF